MQENGNEFWREDDETCQCDKWVRRELANNAGHNIRIATGYGEFVCGRILSVKGDTVYLEDSRGDRFGIRSEMIAYYKIKKQFMAKARKRMEKKSKAK